MRNKIPPEAFEHYRALGTGRSYAAVAAHYGVSVRGVTKRALKENWKSRLAAIEGEARRQRDEKAVEGIQAIDERHLRTLRAIQHKALQALTSAPTGTAAQACSTLIAAVRAERAILVPPEAPQPQRSVEWREILDDVRQREEARRGQLAREAPPVPTAANGRAPREPGEN